MTTGCLAALLVSVPTEARADWQYVGTSDDGRVSVSYDPDSVRLVRGEMRVWVTLDHSRNPAVREREARHLWSYDCTEETGRLISYLLYDASGRVIESHTNQYAQAEPVPPDTINSAVFRTVCSGDSRF